VSAERQSPKQGKTTAEAVGYQRRVMLASCANVFFVRVPYADLGVIKVTSSWQYLVGLSAVAAPAQRLQIVRCR
jgi:hypothetical protein